MSSSQTRPSYQTQAKSMGVAMLDKQLDANGLIDEISLLALCSQVNIAIVPDLTATFGLYAIGIGARVLPRVLNWCSWCTRVNVDMCLVYAIETAFTGLEAS